MQSAIMTWGWFSQSGLDSAMLGAEKREGQLSAWIY